MPDIDGIKKIDKKDIKKSRKIVLDSISDEIKKQQIKDAKEEKERPLRKKIVSDIKPDKKKVKKLFTLKPRQEKKVLPEKMKERGEAGKKVRIMDDIKPEKNKSFQKTGSKASAKVVIEKPKIEAKKISAHDKQMWQSEMKNLLQSEKVEEKEKKEAEEKLKKAEQQVPAKKIKTFSLHKKKVLSKQARDFQGSEQGLGQEKSRKQELVNLGIKKEEVKKAKEKAEKSQRPSESKEFDLSAKKEKKKSSFSLRSLFGFADDSKDLEKKKDIKKKIEDKKKAQRQEKIEKEKRKEEEKIRKQKAKAEKQLKKEAEKKAQEESKEKARKEKEEEKKNAELEKARKKDELKRKQEEDRIKKEEERAKKEDEEKQLKIKNEKLKIEEERKKKEEERKRREEEKKQKEEEKRKREQEAEGQKRKEEEDKKRLEAEQKKLAKESKKKSWLKGVFGKKKKTKKKKREEKKEKVEKTEKRQAEKEGGQKLPKKKEKKQHVKVESMDDDFDFNLTTYQKFRTEARQKEEEENQEEKSRKEEKRPRQKIKNEKSNFFSRIFSARKKGPNKFKHSLREHELDLAPPDLAHDELIAHEELGSSRPRIKKARKPKVPLRLWPRLLSIRLKGSWSDFKLYALSMIIVFITLYSLLLIMTLKIEIDNKLTRFVADFLPIPAVISSNHVIDYYSYLDLRQSYCRGICSAQESKDFKVWLVNRIILYNLIDRYGLQNDPGANEKLEHFIIFDNEVNQVGINRIQKIKSIIDEEGNFFRNAQKYGDQVGQFKIENIEGAIADLKIDLQKIEDKKTSRVVYGADGYYLFYVDRELDKESVSYVFIAGKSLEEYLVEKLNGFQIWSLVD